MRILYVVRLFSGIEEGLREGVWRPKGVPTICNLIEVLDRGPHDLHLIFSNKDYGSTWDEKSDRTFSIVGLRTPVTVLAGERLFPVWLGKLRSRFVLIRQMFKIWQAARRIEPDLIYFDRAHIWPAAWAARFGRIPVAWRVMGVLPPMRDALDGRGPRNAMWRWAFRAPFAAVICTLDGSGGNDWMEHATASSVQGHCLLNGVGVADGSSLNIDDRLPTDRTVVMFVGRLESLKGGQQFVEAFIAAWRLVSGQLHAVLIGDGSQRPELEQIVRDAGASDAFSFIGSVPHTEVLAWHGHSDIYVSLNRMGNLSNANLEALASGSCCLFPCSKPDQGIDLDTDAILPADVAVRFGAVDDVSALSGAILHLHHCSEDRRARGQRAMTWVRENISSWHQRMASELAILERIARQPAVTSHGAQ